VSDADVYVDSDRPDLEHWLERELGRRLHVERNDDRDPERAAEFPDGFLYFATLVEAGPQEVTAQLLRLLWDAGIPAVAATDYEDELPEGGGYGSRRIPWPG
jgi:hypothetical protein